MRNIFLYLITITLFSSCKNQKVNSDFSKNFGTYSLMLGELSFQTHGLNQQIEFELFEIEKNNEKKIEVKKIDSLTKIYTKKIDEILEELSVELHDDLDDITKSQSRMASSEKVNNYFFKGDSLTDKAKSFKTANNEYQNQIYSYFSKPLYADYARTLLSMEDFRDRDNNKNEFFNYHFRDIPLIAVLVKLKSMKRNSLELEKVLILKNN